VKASVSRLRTGSAGGRNIFAIRGQPIGYEVFRIPDKDSRKQAFQNQRKIDSYQ
jgi:hypothetical protein